MLLPRDKTLVMQSQSCSSTHAPHTRMKSATMASQPRWKLPSKSVEGMMEQDGGLNLAACVLCIRTFWARICPSRTKLILSPLRPNALHPGAPICPLDKYKSSAMSTVATTVTGLCLYGYSRRSLSHQTGMQNLSKWRRNYWPWS